MIFLTFHLVQNQIMNANKFEIVEKIPIPILARNGKKIIRKNPDR